MQNNTSLARTCPSLFSHQTGTRFIMLVVDQDILIRNLCHLQSARVWMKWILLQDRAAQPLHTLLKTVSGFTFVPKHSVF